MSVDEVNKGLKELENCEILDKVLRFLIDDRAFSTDFLVTTIIDYCADNPNKKE